jgi:hypothetical protein
MPNNTDAAFFLEVQEIDSTASGMGEPVSDLQVREQASASDVTTDGAGVYAYTDSTSPGTVTISSDDIAHERVIIVKDKGGNASTNNITVDTEGSETIDGSASVAINSNYGSVRLYSDGDNLFTF